VRNRVNKTHLSINNEDIPTQAIYARILVKEFIRISKSKS